MTLYYCHVFRYLIKYIIQCISTEDLLKSRKPSITELQLRKELERNYCIDGRKQNGEI